MDKRRKKDRKRRREQKVKSRVRAAQLSQAEGIGEETGPETLFSLARVKGKGGAGLGDDAAAPDFEGADDLATSSSEGDDGAGASAGSDWDSDDEQRRWAGVGHGGGGWGGVAWSLAA